MVSQAEYDDTGMAAWQVGADVTQPAVQGNQDSFRCGGCGDNVSVRCADQVLVSDGIDIVARTGQIAADETGRFSSSLNSPRLRQREQFLARQYGAVGGGRTYARHGYRGYSAVTVYRGGGVLDDERSCWRYTVSVTVMVRWPTKRAMFSSGIKARRPVP